MRSAACVFACSCACTGQHACCVYMHVCPCVSGVWRKDNLTPRNSAMSFSLQDLWPHSSPRHVTPGSLPVGLWPQSGLCFMCFFQGTAGVHTAPGVRAQLEEARVLPALWEAPTVSPRAPCLFLRYLGDWGAWGIMTLWSTWFIPLGQVFCPPGSVVMAHLHLHIQRLQRWR